MAVESEPKPIWTAPSRADALPATFENGASESADVLGNVKPWQERKMKIRKIELKRPSVPLTAPKKSEIPVRLWQKSATRTICSLVYFLRKRLLSWLAPINPRAINAKIHPYWRSLTLYSSIKT